MENGSELYPTEPAPNIPGMNPEVWSVITSHADYAHKLKQLDVQQQAEVVSVYNSLSGLVDNEMELLERVYKQVLGENWKSERAGASKRNSPETFGGILV